MVAGIVIRLAVSGPGNSRARLVDPSRHARHAALYSGKLL